MDDTGLTEVPRTERQYDSNNDWCFSQGEVRKAFKRVYSPDRNYVLFQTIANAEAVEALKQYVGFRESMDSPWQVRKFVEGEKLRDVSDVKRLIFDNDLMDSYRMGIGRMAEGQLGLNHFSHYPMVSTDGVHSLARDPKAIFWPRIYLVNEEKQDQLKGIIDRLADDTSLEVLRELESPQFYQMAGIETLNKLKIAPIVRLERELKLGAQDLSMYVDFLTQCKETCRSRGFSPCD